MQPSNGTVLKRDQREADDDLVKSLLVAYQAIKERMAKGGPGWTPREPKEKGGQKPP